MIVDFLTCRTFGFGIGGFSGCRIAGSSLFDCAGPSRIAISALISSPCELDAAGVTFTVCLGSFGFGSLLLLRDGALGSAGRILSGVLVGRIRGVGALDGRILEGALVGRILGVGALDGRILVGSGWLLNNRGSVCISA